MGGSAWSARFRGTAWNGINSEYAIPWNRVVLVPLTIQTQEWGLGTEPTRAVPLSDRNQTHPWGGDAIAHVRVCPLGCGCAQRAAAPQIMSGVDVIKKQKT